MALLPRPLGCLAEAAACLQAVRGEGAPVELTLGTRFELGMSWIVPLLPTLKAALPQVTLHLFFGSGHEVIERLRAGLIDCAVTSAEVTDVRLAGARLHEERYAFVAAPRLLQRQPLAQPVLFEKKSFLVPGRWTDYLLSSSAISRWPSTLKAISILVT